MNIKELQQLEMGLLLVILLNHLIFELPVITTIFILLSLGMMYYRVFIYNTSAVEDPSTVKGTQNKLVENNNEQITPEIAAKQLTDTLNYEVITINQELNQAHSIIKSATSNISSSFGQLNTIISGQSLLTDHPQLEQISSEVIKALQFEDLTSQIIHSLQKCTQTLLELSNDIPYFTERVCTQGDKEIELLQKKWLDILQNSKQRSANKVVSQETMDEGDIDLF